MIVCLSIRRRKKSAHVSEEVYVVNRQITRLTGLILCQTAAAAAILQVGRSIQMGLAGVYIPLLTATHTEDVQTNTLFHTTYTHKVKNLKTTSSRRSVMEIFHQMELCFVFVSLKKIQEENSRKLYRRRDDFFSVQSSVWTTEWRDLNA